ncbi:MAG: acetate kinase, partial [Ruminococcaceae bacterium]|nr:acetate kinase [Oscillospiraceae bacterium]
VGKEVKMVNCHLGNGSSMAAIKNGECQDTTMGLTPICGVPMGTRCGDIDAGVIQFLCNTYGMDINECMNVLNKKSGVLGISGVSSDFRDLESAAKDGNQRAQLALDKFHYEVRKDIGAYAAAMGGVDAIVFTAGVGENGPHNRAEICKGLEYMGVKLDPERNNVRGDEHLISADDSAVKVFVIATNEELMIARDTKAIVEKQ